MGLHHAQWDTWDMSGMIPSLLGLWDGRDSGITPCTVGHLAHVWDGPFSPGTLGWERQWDYTMHSGTLGTCLGWSLPFWDSGIGGTVGLHHAQWDVSRIFPVFLGPYVPDTGMGSTVVHLRQ